MEDVKLKYYVLAIVDDDCPDEHYYVGVEMGLFPDFYISPDIEDAIRIRDAADAVRFAEEVAEKYPDFGRPYIASVAVTIKWTVV